MSDNEKIIFRTTVRQITNSTEVNTRDYRTFPTRAALNRSNLNSVINPPKLFFVTNCKYLLWDTTQKYKFIVSLISRAEPSEHKIQGYKISLKFIILAAYYSIIKLSLKGKQITLYTHVFQILNQLQIQIKIRQIVHRPTKSIKYALHLPYYMKFSRHRIFANFEI